MSMQVTKTTTMPLGEPVVNIPYTHTASFDPLPEPSYTTCTSCSPVLDSLRDERGLDKKTEYVFLDNGRVNWRAMLKPEHLVINKQYAASIEKKHGKNPDVTQVEDRYLLILLAGIKYLANLRGYTEVKPNVVHISDHRAVVQTDITWIGNFEDDFRTITFGDVGAAAFENTEGFGRNFLEAIACNRAFVRAVRNFLGVNIVANDEIGDKKASEETTPSGAPVFDAIGLLRAKIESSKDENFETFRSAVIKRYKDQIKSDPVVWKTYSDMPISDAYVLLSIITDREEKSKK